MANKPIKPRNILLDQPLFLQKLYKEWDNLSKSIATNINFTKTSTFKKFSKKKRFCIQMQIFFMKRYFKWLDKRIVLGVLEKNDKALSDKAESSKGNCL